MARLIRANRQVPRLLRGDSASALAQSDGCQLADAVMQLAETLERSSAQERKARECDFQHASHLGIAIAEHLIGTAVQDSPETLLTLLMPLVEPMKGCLPLEVRAHPSDASRLTQALRKFPSANTQLAVTADSTLTRGSLLVLGPNSAVDGRLETRLKLIEQTMQDAVCSQRNTPQ